MTKRSAADPPSPPAILPYPPELPDGLGHRPRVLQLIDGDAVSHGLADDSALDRASNQQLRSCLALVYATAQDIDPRPRVRCAASTQTATRHLDVMTASGNNLWVVRRGVDGADLALLEELNHLIDARETATQPGRKRQAGGQVADLVILVAQDHIYAPAVRRLRLLGIPTWLVVPGHFVAADLYASACAVSYIGPRLGRNTTETG
jgi:hypothetical protein